jgi:predicted TIM-barrel fold metal-dependent hydrolase
MIVDAHTHLLPERLAAAIRRFFVERGAPELLYPYEPHAARERIRAAGIARCWSLPYAHRRGVAAGLNGWMAQEWADDPFVVPGATVHPEDDVAEVVEDALALGLSVFKLHCSVGRFPPDDERLDPLWDRVSSTRHPVVVHAGSAHEGTATAEEVRRLSRIAQRWPEARIVVAHCGSPAEEETLALVRRSPSVYADLCPVVAEPVRVDREQIAGIERRILFGSDAPTAGVTIESGVERVRAWGLSRDDEEAVLGGTANALLAAVD